MKKAWILGTAIAVTLVTALPAAAESPEMILFPWDEQLQPVDNPCTEEWDEIQFTSSTVIREILFPDGRRVTAVSYEIVSPEPWTGTGTDTGVEQEQGNLVSSRWVVTNSETGQKFNFTLRGHDNANTDVFTGSGPDTRCLVP